MTPNININPPLSNIQFELLKLFTQKIPEEHLMELKRVIANFLLEKARDKADKIWEQKGYSEETINNLLNGQ